MHDRKPPVSECEVSVTDVTGRRRTLKVRAYSLYSAVFAYNAEVVSGSARDYPRPTRETELEVRAPDGRILRTTFGKAADWANRPKRR